MIMVIPCENKKGEYFTLYNDKTGYHCHCMTHKDVKKVLGAYKCIRAGKPCLRFGSAARLKALKLDVGGKTL